jgi:hypothetical protein
MIYAVSDASASMENGQYGGKWRTVATSITRIDLIPSTGNFIIGSLFTLRGEP